jgi:hypothetical protein
VVECRSTRSRTKGTPERVSLLQRSAMLGMGYGRSIIHLRTLMQASTRQSLLSAPIFLRPLELIMVQLLRKVARVELRGGLERPLSHGDVGRCDGLGGTSGFEVYKTGLSPRERLVKGVDCLQKSGCGERRGFTFWPLW